MSRGVWKRLKTTTKTWEPLPGFHEVAPNVWVPQGYRPTAWERPTPVVRTNAEAAAEYARCAASLPHLLLRHCWSLHTDDPSGVPTYRKFPAYPYIVDFLKHVQEPADFHVEKSRQLLFSWLWMGVFLWDINFHDQWANVAFSTLENLVDDGGENSTIDSLFGKLRVLWQSLPPYLQHAMAFRRLLIQCPATGSYIRGRAASAKGARGPAYKRGLVDEAAHIQHSETLFRAMRASVKRGLILNSTPLGKTGVFPRIRFQATTTFRRLSYHWSLHPERAQGLYCTCGWLADGQANEPPHEQFQAHACLPLDDGSKPVRQMRSPWYDRATADYTSEQVASEFDLSYEKSMRGRVYDAFDQTRHVREYQATIGPQGPRESARAYRIRYLKGILDPDLITVCGWDFGVQDPTALCLGQVVDESRMRIRWIDEFEHNNQSWRFYRQFVNSLWVPLVKEITGLDILHYGDPSGKGRNAELTSWIANLALPMTDDAAKDLGPPVGIITGPRVGRNLEWFDLIRELMRRGEFEISEWCARMIDSLGQYHFPLDSEGNPVPGEHEPVHDEWSHLVGAAMRYVYMFRYHNRLKRQEAGTLVPAKSMLEIGRGNRRDQMKRF